jgi:hypothetical protein
MSVLDDQAEMIRDNFSHEAVFQPAVGDAVSLKVEFVESEDDEPVGGEGTTSQTRREVQFLKSDLAAEPQRDETFTIDSTTYKMKSVLQRDNWFMTVSVK